MLLDGDIRLLEIELFRALPWASALDDVRQRVLLDMAFNLGLPGLLQFKRTLEAIRTGQYQQAATMMLDSLWARQVGQRAERLSRMMATGATPRELWPPA
jgi:lysozyme